MADSKSSTSTSSSTKSKPSGTTARKKTTTTIPRPTEEKAAASGTQSTAQGNARPSRMNLDPEHVGRMLHQRTTWIDEILAIVFIVLGIVTILSLFNTSSTTALSTAWSHFIRQLFGTVGTILVSFMIMAVGVLIFLPHIGVHVRMPWQRILTIEIAFLAFLSLLHILAHDPEPRALARAGAGGGYVGWALSEIMVKLFGTALSTLFFSVVTIVALGTAVGIRRSHVRKAVTNASARLDAFSKRMKEPRPQKPIRIPRPRPDHALPSRFAPFRRQQPDSPTKSTPMARPLHPAEPAPAPRPVSTPVTASHPNTPVVRITSPRRIPDITPEIAEDMPLPPAPPILPAVPAQLAVNPPVEEFVGPESPPMPKPAPAPGTPRKSTSARTPVPPPPPKVTRQFTVEDFKETRVTFARRPDCPPLTLLNDVELNKPTEQEINSNAQIIENTLLEFDIDVEVVDVKVGPTVTQYAVQPFREVTNDQGQVVMQRVRVNKIASLSNDLALALSAKRLRIQPYVPGRSYMGIEVPNRTPSIVALRPVMESETFANAYIKADPEAPSQTRDLPLVVPLGRDVSGAAIVVDLATMPHLLIAGTTGSGKSVCIGALTLSLVMNNMPDRVKLVLLDPKMVELNRFNGLPHLLGPVETDMERIIGVLRWATREMDRRYKLLEVESARNIEVYNRTLGEARKAEQLPYIVFLVDEIGDLMLSRPDEMERTLTRLAQMARAVGMHLVVATQRPSVDIITGLIKANFPARISFAVASGVDSRVILDNTGAETLMGRGDMLYQAPDAAGPQRVQGCYVSDPEIEAVVAYWKDWQSKQGSVPGADNFAPWERGMTRRESLSESDPMLEDAIDLVIREGEASASQIQRQLGIAYPRAAHLLDLLAELGIVGKLKEGTRSREVLIKPGTNAYKNLMQKRKR